MKTIFFTAIALILTACGSGGGGGSSSMSTAAATISTNELVNKVWATSAFGISTGGHATGNNCRIGLKLTDDGRFTALFLCQAPAAPFEWRFERIEGTYFLGGNAVTLNPAASQYCQSQSGVFVGAYAPAPITLAIVAGKVQIQYGGLTWAMFPQTDETAITATGFQGCYTGTWRDLAAAATTTI